MPMPVSVSAFAYGHPVPAGPPLVVVVVVRVPADGPQSAEPAAGEPVHLDFGLALRRLRKAPLAVKTRRLYADALRRFGAWPAGRLADDAKLTACLDELSGRGLAPESGVLVVAAVARAALECARAGECSENPVGPATRDKQGKDVLVYSNGCVEGVSESRCDEAKDIAAEIQTVHQEIGEVVGTGNTITVRLYENGHPREPQARGHYYRSEIGLRHDWAKSTVHHETGHAFFEKHIDETGAIEERGADEGVAMVIAEAVGNVYYGTPGANSVAGILAGGKCTTTGADCAHELGRLVAKRFRDLEALKGTTYALDMYLEAVRNIAGTVTPDTLATQVAHEIMRKEGIVLQPGPGGDDEQPPENPEWVNVGGSTFASLSEALSYYLAFYEGTGLFCITLPVVGNVCLWNG